MRFLDPRGVRTRAPDPSPPLSGRFLTVLLDTTAACNLRCRTCWQSLPARPAAKGASASPAARSVALSDAALERVAREVLPFASSANYSCVAEPFSHPGFLDFLDMAAPAEVPFSTIPTNGTRLPNETIERVHAAGVSRLTFSFDGARRETFESIRRGADFDGVVENVLRLKAWKEARRTDRPSVQINCILSRRNVAELGEIVDLAARLGAVELHLRHAIAIEGLDVESDSLAHAPDESDRAVRAAVRRAEHAGVRVPEPPLFAVAAPVRRPSLRERMAGALRAARPRVGAPACRRPWENLSIHPDGSVYPCDAWIFDPSRSRAAPLFPPEEGSTTSPDEYRMGSVEEKPFAEIWNGPKFVALRESLIGARPMKDFCVRCPLRLGDPLRATVGRYSPSIERGHVPRRWSDPREAKGRGENSSSGCM